MKTINLLKNATLGLCLFSGLNSIAQNCNALFSITAGNTAGLFSFASTGNNTNSTSYYWSLDNGVYIGSGHTNSLSYQFPANGTYQVCLQVVDSLNNMCWDYKCDSVVVSGLSNNNGGGCQASFLSYPDSSQTGYTFFSTSAASPSALYSWTIDGVYSGSGNVMNSNLSNGLHQVCLTVNDSANNCSDTFCDYVDVNNNGGGCQASYVAFLDSINGFTFVSTSNVSPSATYSWSVDGTSAGSSPVLSTPLNNGLHTVCLTVTDSVNNCSDMYCDTINTSNINNGGGCHAYFIMLQDSVFNGDWYALNLSGTSTPGTALSYLWNFGDGTTSTLQFPSHQYAVPGHYNICLTISDNNGCTDTYCDTSVAHKMSSAASGMSSITVIASATGIKKKDLASTEISAYPNPVTDQVNLNISIAEKASVSIQIVDLIGKVVNVQKTSLSAGSNSVKLNTSELPQGVYMIQVTNLANNQSKTLRIVK